MGERLFGGEAREEGGAEAHHWLLQEMGERGPPRLTRSEQWAPVSRRALIHPQNTPGKGKRHQPEAGGWAVTQNLRKASDDENREGNAHAGHAS